MNAGIFNIFSLAEADTDGNGTIDFEVRQ